MAHLRRAEPVLSLSAKGQLGPWARDSWGQVRIDPCARPFLIFCSFTFFFFLNGEKPSSFSSGFDLLLIFESAELKLYMKNLLHVHFFKSIFFKKASKNGESIPCFQVSAMDHDSKNTSCVWHHASSTISRLGDMDSLFLDEWVKNFSLSSPFLTRYGNPPFIKVWKQLLSSMWIKIVHKQLVTCTLFYYYYYYLKSSIQKTKGPFSQLKKESFSHVLPGIINEASIKHIN